MSATRWLGLLGTVVAAWAMPAQAQTDDLDAASAKVVRVAVYRGPAACEDCPEAAKRAFEKAGQRYRVEFVGPREKTDISVANLARYDVYVQPGGGQDIPGALKSLGTRRAEAIRGFVSKGGRFVGICMGAYLADVGGFGLVPQELDTEVGRPGFPVTTIEDASVTVRWAGRVDKVFYQDGPYLPAQPRDPGFRAIATYQNGDLAAARYSFGKGIVVLVGPHPEADQSWFEAADLPLEDMPRTNLFKDLLDHLKV